MPIYKESEPELADLFRNRAPLKLTGYEADPIKEMVALLNRHLAGGVPSMGSVLPAMFNLNGKPFSLEDHFYFEPFFKTRLPRTIVWKTARQVGKTQSMAMQGTMISAMQPHFTTIYVTPLFEMIRRFSSYYVKSAITESPMRTLWTDTFSENSVLSKTFRNGSKMIVTYAGTDCKRVRGASGNRLGYDERQDLDPEHLSIIGETISHSEFGEMVQITGTPKTAENLLELDWQRSSQAEWHIPCDACHHENIPALNYDLEAMLGPAHPDISKRRPGVICAKCQAPIQPRNGFWRHRYPELRHINEGYHVPQCIVPLHYENRDNWIRLLDKQRRYAPYRFWNEVCGETYDLGTRIISLSDLQRAAVLAHHTGTSRESLDAARALLHQYVDVVLACDWGGAGAKEVSYTALAVLGLLPNGHIDVIWGHRSLTPADHIGEAELCLKIFTIFRCTRLVHDFGGAGSFREKYILDAGVPLERIVPIAYVRASSAGLMQHKPATDRLPRDYWTLDKARSLDMTIQMIKQGRICFFQDDWKSPEDPGVLRDFLALTEDRISARFGKDIYTIIREASKPDDFAQAVNIGCCALWHAHGAWPRDVHDAKYTLSGDALAALEPNDAPEYW